MGSASSTDRNDSTTSTSTSTSTTTWQNISKVHIIVLVHGWLGNPKEMEYLKQSLARQVQLRALHVPLQALPLQQAQNTDLLECNPIELAVLAQPDQDPQQLFVIHSAQCNSGKMLTSDGIAAGGQRLANEIDQLVDNYSNYEYSNTNTNTNTNTKEQVKVPRQITLSLVGNSLGGLYCRYAISTLKALQTQTSVVVPKIFCTTCTPHLGVSQHTYVTLPTWIESPIATIMLRTGIDLFRRSSIIQDMAVQTAFVKPLRAFEQRVAYINVWGTDFQVPTSTAAFWADTDSMHYTVRASSTGTDESNASTGTSTGTSAVDTKENNENEDDHNIVLQLATPQQLDNKDNTSTSTTFLSSKELSVRLDNMGWRKYLCDVRHHLPLSRKRSSLSSTFSTGTGTGTNRGQEETGEEKWTARDLLQEFDRNYFKTIPLGHTVMVANAKDSLNQYLTTGGRPTMDYLASSMIQQLLLSPPSSSNESENENESNQKDDKVPSN
jgi:hypothetical protein